MPKRKHRKLRKEIIATCRAMNAAGVNQGTSGNVSARIDGGFLITPSGIPYEKMKPKQIVEMDLAGGYYGEFLPSSEWRMHYDIYRARPEAEVLQWKDGLVEFDPGKVRRFLSHPVLGGYIILEVDAEVEGIESDVAVYIAS